MPVTYKLADYRREAARDPFVLVVDDETTIEIAPPNTDDMLDAAASTDVRTQLRKLCGEAYGPLMDALGKEQGSVLKVVVNDLSRHFGLGEL